MMVGKKQSEIIAALDDGTKKRGKTRQQSFFGGQFTTVAKPATTEAFAMDFTSSAPTRQNPGAGERVCIKLLYSLRCVIVCRVVA